MPSETIRTEEQSGVSEVVEARPAMAACDICGCECEASEMRQERSRREYVLVCEDCADDASHCSRCGGLFHNVHLRSTMEGDQYCESCADRVGLFTCSSCENTYTESNYGSDGECQGCEESHRSNGAVSEYGHTRAERFYGEGPVWYGVELEVEIKGAADRDELAEETAELFADGFVQIKEDGSLDNGFEIATQPASVAKHRELWGEFFGNLPSSLRSWQTSTCGMHVHVSRRGLSTLQIGKMLVLLNSYHNNDFVFRMAGRSHSEWAVIKAKKVSDATKRNSTKYEALNLRPEETIEFRIFKGTLNPVRFFGNLEFCEALVKFCGVAEHSLADCQRADCFVAYVHGQKKTWPSLWSRLRGDYIRLGLPIKDNSKAANGGSIPNEEGA